MLFKAKMAAENFFKDEKGEVNVVAIVVLIAVAVVLALFFKEEIAGILSDLLEGIGDKAETSLDDI
ncbi:MAG: flagellin-like protein [Clostridia bacterium]|nr:flagellin-like protein [Clostridia bacterium]